MRAEIKAPIILSAGMLSFSVMSALVKIAVEEVPPIEAVFFRCIVGLPILAFYASRKKISLRGHRKGLLLGRAFCGTAALVLFFHAIADIPVANAILLNQSAPIFVLPLAVFFLHEKVSKTHVALVFLALVGVALVIKPSSEMINIPGLLGLASAVFAAAVYVLVRKLTQTENTTTIVFWFTAFAAVSTIPMVAPVFVVPGPTTLATLVGVGIFATIGQYWMTSAYRYGEAGRLAVIGSSAAVFGVFFDYLIWTHLPDTLTLVGGITVIFCCSLIQMLRK
jgi:drug/metabolite transporter (DMT)-like permease